MTTNTTDHQEKIENTSQGKFSIDLIPIENKNDKFSYFTNLSILSKQETVSQANTILKNLGIYVDSSSDTGFPNETNKDYKFLKQEFINNGYSTSSRYKSNAFLKSGCLLFCVKSIYLQNKTLIIETTDNMKFMTQNIEQYLQEGASRLDKKNDGEIKSYLAQQTQAQKLVLDAGILKIKSKQLLAIGADDYCIIDESKNKLCILKDNKIATYTYDEDSIDRQSDYFDLSIYGNIKNIRTDTNNNFYFIICEKEGKSELKVLNRKTLEDVMSFRDLAKIVYLSDEQGKLFCMDADGYLRIVTINTQNLERGYVDAHEITAETNVANVIKIEDKPRSDLKTALQSGGIILNHTHDVDAIEEDNDIDDAQLREQLRNTPVDGMDGKTLKELYTQAKTPKEINIVYHLASKLKNNPQIIAVKGLIDPIITAITQKKDAMYLDDIGQQIQDIAKDITDVNDFASLVQVQQKIQKLKETRSQILVANKEIDTLIKDTFKIIKEKLEQYKQEHGEKIMEDVEKNCGHIAQYMQEIDYMTQITSIYSTELWKNTENMLQYLDDENRKKYKKKMSEMVQKRQTELSQEQKFAEKSALQEQEENINNIKNKLTQLKTITENINDESTLTSMESSDPLVIDIQKEIDTLPGNKSQELQQRLEQIFKERMLSIQFNKDAAKTSIKSLDQYGIPKSLYFVPDVVKKVKREVSAKPTKDNLFKLQFIASTGNVIEPDINKKIVGNFKFTYTREERQELKKTLVEWNSNGTRKKYQDIQEKVETLKQQKGYEENQDYQEAQKKLKELGNKFYIPRMIETMDKMSNNGVRSMATRPNLPSIDNRTVITQSVQKSLAKRGRILDQQLLYKQGIMIVESEAGTGKNFKCDILGHLTNREIFDISCNEYMEKEDLLFSPEIDNDGTHRKPSKLVQALQTPGAVIVLDEINTLKPGVSKLLNPLLDGRRYINDPQMGRIKAHPSVLIVGLMNPRYYLGTKQLPQEVVSRSRMTNDDYAPMIEEAFMISKYLEGPIGKVSQEEFSEYREEYIIKKQKPTDKTVYNAFVALEKVVKTAREIRSIYSETMKGNAQIGKELHYVFTIRDGNFVIQDFNHTKNIQEALEDIIIPKIADFEEKESAKELIKQACN